MLFEPLQVHIAFLKTAMLQFAFFPRMLAERDGPRELHPGGKISGSRKHLAAAYLQDTTSVQIQSLTCSYPSEALVKKQRCKSLQSLLRTVGCIMVHRLYI